MTTTHHLYISFEDQNVADDARTWVDFGTDLISWNTVGGRDSKLSEFDAVQSSFLLKNQDRELDPTYAGSPHYPDVTPGCKIVHQVDVDGILHTNFYGDVDSFVPQWDDGGVGIYNILIRCTDPRKLLGLNTFQAADPDVLDYPDVVMADEPVWYGRSGERAGTRAAHHVRRKRKRRDHETKKHYNKHGFKRWTTKETREEVGGITGEAGAYKNSPKLAEPGAIAGDSDKCVRYRRANSEYARIHFDNAEDFTSAEVSMEAWVKLASNTGGTVLAAPRNSTLADSIARLYCSMSGGNFTAHFYVPDALGGTAADGSIPGALNTWYHIVGTKDSLGNVKIYINGVDAGTGFSAGAVTPNDATLYLYIASTNGSDTFDGWIDEPAFYQSALPVGRALAHYTAGLLGFPANTTGGRILDVLRLSDPAGTEDLTLSGNEITDAVRKTGTSGDMRPIRFPVMEADCEICDRTTLSGAMTNVQTTIPLTALPSKWPTGSSFRVMVDKETILVKPDGTLNPPCVRGVAQRWATAQAAAAHSSGAVVSNWIDGWMLGTASSKAYSLGGIPSDQIQIVSDIVRNGTRAWKMIVRPGDANDAADLTRERAEMARLGLGELGERWYHSWSTYLPVGFHANQTFPGATIFQLGPNYGQGSPAMAVRVNQANSGPPPHLGENYFRIVFNTGVDAVGYIGTYTNQFDIVYATEGVWHDFILYVDWNLTSGTVYILHRIAGGAWSKVFEVTGVPTSTDFAGLGTPSVQRRQGIYRPADASLTNYLYLDEVRAGTSIEDVLFDTLPLRDDSTGIWPGTTNLLANDTFTVAGTAVITSDATVPLFGVSSKKVDFLALSDYVHRTFSGLTIGTVYTASLWVKREEVDARLLTFAVRNAANSADVATTSVRAVRGWTRVQVTWTAAETSGRIRLIMTDTVNKPVRAWIGSSQVEAAQIATPYTPVGTVRSNARVQVPSDTLSPTAGWIAFRVRIPWGNANEPGAGSGLNRIWFWGDGAENFQLYYQESDNKFKAAKFKSSASIGTATVTRPLQDNGDDYITIVVRWDANTIALSVDGQPFVSVSAVGTPTVGGFTTFDLGRVSTSATSYMYGSIFWAAWSKGTVTDADAASLQANGIWKSSLSGQKGYRVWTGSTNLAARWNIQPGQYSMPPERYAGRSPTDIIFDAVAAEGEPALFFYSKAGAATFLDKNYRSQPGYSSPSFSFGAGTGKTDFENSGLTEQDSFLYNDIRATNEDGTETFRAEDATSIAKYGRRVLSLDSVPLATDVDIQAYVDGLLAKYKDPLVFIPALALDGLDTEALNAILSLDLGDCVSTSITHTVGPIITTQVSYVERRSPSQGEREQVKGVFSVSPR